MSVLTPLPATPPQGSRRFKFLVYGLIALLVVLAAAAVVLLNGGFAGAAGGCGGV